MHKSNHTALRALLRQAPDGATATDLARQAGIACSSASRALRTMPDAYVDRWQPVAHDPVEWAAVWCAAVVPEHCPKPERKALHATA